MKFIETTFSYDEGKSRNGTANGVLKEDRHAINYNHIVSISPWNGELTYKGRTGTQIKDVNGRTYLDDRSYHDFIADLRYDKIIETI